MDGTHSRKLQLVQIQTVFFIDEFVALLVDCVPVNVFFSQGYLSRSRLSLRNHGHELNLTSHDVVVIRSSILVSLHFQIHEVSEHFLKPLAASAQNVVVLASFDRILGDHSDRLFEAINFSLPQFFLPVFCDLRSMVFFTVNFAHAHSITALIVDQDEAFLTLAADVAENVVLTAENVDEALAFIEVVVVSALFAKGAVLGGTFASDGTDLSLDIVAEEQEY